jgi:hypothetical protein
MTVQIAALPCTGLYAAVTKNSPYLFDNFTFRNAATSSTTVVEQVAEISKDFVVYPNPGSGLFYIEAVQSSNKISSISVYDAAGKLILEDNIGLNQNHNQPASFSLDGNVDGLYVVWVKYENGSSSHALISLVKL